MLVLQFCRNFYGFWCYLNKAITAAVELFEARKEMSVICTGILLINKKVCESGFAFTQGKYCLLDGGQYKGKAVCK